MLGLSRTEEEYSLLKVFPVHTRLLLVRGNPAPCSVTSGKPLLLFEPQGPPLKWGEGSSSCWACWGMELESTPSPSLWKCSAVCS